MNAALTRVFRSRSVDQTLAAAAALARGLSPGDVVALFGDLGAGKTRFVEGASRELGYNGRVRSPSFTLLNIYRGTLPIYHFDLYRWAVETGELELEGWEEFFDGEGVSFIEWAENLGPHLPGRSLVVKMAHAQEQHRILTVEATEAHHRTHLETLDIFRSGDEAAP